MPDAASRYIDHLLLSTPHDLHGLRIVVDCANGAASTTAPQAYRRAGAEVIAINADPNGLNINDGVGSTHLDVLQAAVVEHGADLGIAHDGDADRCLAVDGTGPRWTATRSWRCSRWPSRTPASSRTTRWSRP
ncbi:hypothetical protein [Kutzneria kofuensis]|uniref:hypothetical protein n=1 Tax=Kutzneria kofuensis TaxID=103725 RepID=UPI003387E046